MTDQGSVTVWLDRLKAGDQDEAVRRLWAGYFGQLVGLARDRLRTRTRAAVDEEDVALAAFDSFVRAAAAGRFPRLDDRDDLWRVLLTLTARKAADAVQAEARQKRGGGRVVSASAVTPDDTHLHVPAPGPDPADAAAMAEALDGLLFQLGDDLLRRIAVLKLEGYSNEEIGAAIGRSVPTVERKLKLIRELWAGAGA